MRPALPLVLLVASLALAGCTAQVDGAKEQLDTVKQGLEDAKQALADAQREAQEAKDRFDRVKSLEVVREERVALVVQPVLSDGTLTFRATSATRSDGTSVPLANLTRLPLLTLTTEGGYSFGCDPMTCRAELADGETLTAAFADAPGVTFVLEGGKELPALTLANARVHATTAAGDATD